MTVFSARMYGKRSHQNKKFKKAAWALYKKTVHCLT